MRQETFAVEGAASYKYKLYAQENGQYVLYLEDEKDPAKRFASEPFDLKVGEQPKADQGPVKLSALPAGEEAKGKVMEMAQINRAKLLNSHEKPPIQLPDNTLVGLAGLTKFGSRERLWTPNPDGSLTNKKDGTVIRPDFKLGIFVNDKGEKVGVGFRTFTGFDNYIRILTDPRIRGPFFKIFIWTFAFSALSVLFTFALGMLLSVLLAAARYPFSENVPHALHSPLCGSGHPLDPDFEGVVQSGIWGGQRNAESTLWLCSGMGNQSLGGSRDGLVGESSGWAIPT